MQPGGQPNAKQLCKNRLGVLIDTKVNTIQQCVLVTKVTNDILYLTNKNVVVESDCSPECSICEIISGALFEVFGSAVQVKY